MFFFIVIYIDHETILNIAKQIILIINFIDKLNSRFKKVFDYLQRFNLKSKHKSDKQYIVSNVFSKFLNVNTKQLLWKFFTTKTKENVFDALFIVSLIEMNSAFREKILIEYKTNFNWQKIFVTLNEEIESDSFFFIEKTIWYFEKNEFSIYNTTRFCIFHFVIKNVLKFIHNEEHVDYSRCYDKISFNYYIRELFKYFRDYLKHCSNCLMYQTKRHRFYDSLQFILTSSIFFHIITMNFILILFKSRNDFHCAMSIICKFIKSVIVIFDSVKWSTNQWISALLKRLNFMNWNISKIIISNRDRKFLFDFWIQIFQRLEIRFFYSTAYHFQTNDQSERINQIVEIALRFYMNKMITSANWFKMLKFIQRLLNNVIFVIIDKTSNEIDFDFFSLQIVDLNKFFTENFFVVVVSTIDRIVETQQIRVEIANAIMFAQMNVKHYYDRKHQSLFIKKNEYALIRLHHEYQISINNIFDKKYKQQYVDSFKNFVKIVIKNYRSRSVRVNLSNNFSRAHVACRI